MKEQEITEFLQKYRLNVVWNNPLHVADCCVCELQQEGFIPYSDDWGICWNCSGTNLTDAINNAKNDETLWEPQNYIEDEF